MLKTTNPVQQNNEATVIVFQKFNGSYLAKISDNTGKGTHAFGKTKKIAEENVLKMFQLKYSAYFHAIGNTNIN